MRKAIVSDVAGTTRDAVGGSTSRSGGTKFNLYDTAGVRESGDRIESIGIERGGEHRARRGRGGLCGGFGGGHGRGGRAGFGARAG